MKSSDQVKQMNQTDESENNSQEIQIQRRAAINTEGIFQTVNLRNNFSKQTKKSTFQPLQQSNTCKKNLLKQYKANVSNYIQRHSQQLSSQNCSQKKQKKSSQTVFSPFQLSFQDRSSIQTTDQKQFSNYFDNDLIQLVQTIQHPNETNNRKDFFQNHIIQDQEEEEVFTSKSNEHMLDNNNLQHQHQEINFITTNQQQIIVQNYSLLNLQTSYKYQTQQTQQQMNSKVNSFKMVIQAREQYQKLQIQQQSIKIPTKPYTSSNQKDAIKQKQNQIQKLQNAYHQTKDENQLLRKRVIQLQSCLGKITEQRTDSTNYQKHDKQVNNKQNTQVRSHDTLVEEIQISSDKKRKQFEKQVQFLRKYSL